MYYEGNLAISQKKKPQVTYKETRRVVRRKKTIPTQEKLLYLFTIIVCVIVAGLVIFRYAQIYEVNAKLQQMEQQIQLLESENSTLELEVNVLQDPKRLIDKAKQLGLHSSIEEDISEIPLGSRIAGTDQMALKK
ncbi:MAG: cell division protein FtsL [Paenibacillaceae bacterium]